MLFMRIVVVLLLKYIEVDIDFVRELDFYFILSFK